MDWQPAAGIELPAVRTGSSLPQMSAAARAQAAGCPRIVTSLHSDSSQLLEIEPSLIRLAASCCDRAFRSQSEQLAAP
jgi:hypothetical protein